MRWTAETTYNLLSLSGASSIAALIFQLDGFSGGLAGVSQLFTVQVGDDTNNATFSGIPDPAHLLPTTLTYLGSIGSPNLSAVSQISLSAIIPGGSNPNFQFDNLLAVGDGPAGGAGPGGGNRPPSLNPPARSPSVPSSPPPCSCAPAAARRWREPQGAGIFPAHADGHAWDVAEVQVGRIFDQPGTPPGLSGHRGSGASLDPELAADIRHVVVHRSRADAENDGNFGILFALTDPVADFMFPRG